MFNLRETMRNGHGATRQRGTPRVWTSLVLAILAANCLPTSGRADSAEQLEQMVSRENPSFHCAEASLRVGRDGKVYLCSGGKTSYVLRLGRDGKDKAGGTVIYAALNATANADGVLATANGHFNHKIALYNARF